MPIRAWFPTFIYQAAVRLSPRALLEDCFKIRANDVEGRTWCRKHYPGGFTSYASMGRLHTMFSTFMELERKLDPHVRALARRLDMDLDGARLKMTSCWVNIMPRRASHGLHLHPLSVISGTYYVKTPRGSAGLKFEDPRLDRFMASPAKTASCRPANRRHVTYPAAAGRVILFESWLRHEVAPNPGDGERVSVSFNYDWV